ncbi:ScbR family autoregulator-binding transcription factor, partial [Kitasatospora sp. NPDC093558]|uniref:ScbR family autoregulator-binding transcription factor n=1 Tax=Kitasatospora sp. NPDC093558 TaxID=3155201 RepID=UPI00342EF8B1
MVREPKQERAIRTKAVILRAAAEVFDEFGFSGASISKIMKRAGVTPGGMYFHFKSKEALAVEVMMAQADDLDLPRGEDGLQQLIDTTFDIAFELQTNTLLRAGVRLAVEQGEFGVQDDRAYQAWADHFAQQLRAARASGDLLPDVDEEEFARILVGAYSGTQLFSQIASGRADLPDRIESLWRFLLPGIATPEARARLSATVPVRAVKPGRA